MIAKPASFRESRECKKASGHVISDQEEFRVCSTSICGTPVCATMYEALYESEGNIEDWRGREKRKKTTVRHHLG